MKKKIVMLILSMSFILVACGSKQETTQVSENVETTTAVEVESSTVEETTTAVEVESSLIAEEKDLEEKKAEVEETGVNSTGSDTTFEEGEYTGEQPEVKEEKKEEKKETAKKDADDPYGFKAMSDEELESIIPRGMSKEEEDAWRKEFFARAGLDENGMPTDNWGIPSTGGGNGGSTSGGGQVRHDDPNDAANYFEKELPVIERRPDDPLSY